MNEIATKVRDAGVVGAGGAGFPTHVKLAAAAEIYLVNGAECEPLLKETIVEKSSRLRTGGDTLTQ